MTLVMDMERSTRKVLKKDSVVSIKTEGLVGNQFVEISFASEQAAPVEEGDTLRSEPPLDLADVVKKTNQVLDAAKGSMGELQSIGEKINKGQGTMGALVNDKKIYQEMTAATEQAKLGAAAFQENMEAMKHNFLLRGFFNRRGYDDATRLARYEVSSRPDRTPVKRFVLDPTPMFDKPDSAKLKNPKALT